ncbi:hypothetical protein BJF78_00780 [Pseudonocardia sp. CNS-139]|nr:hypothetical protein BJF78_00780 [Pseudonocardia sp. CNS-139]
MRSSGPGAGPRLVVADAVVLTMEDGDPEPFTGYVIADGGSVVDVGRGAPPGVRASDQVVDAAGRIVMPGFVSAHSHLWQSGFAGLAADANVDAWSERLYAHARESLDAAAFAALTAAGARNHLDGGITTAFNFTLSPGGDPAIDRCQAEAALTAGIRVVHGFSVGRFADGYGLPEATSRLRDFLAWTRGPGARFGDRLLGTALAGVGVYWDDEGVQAAADAALMRTFGLRNQLHLLESPATAEVENARFAWLQDSGTVRPALTVAHFVHPSPQVAADCVAAGVAMTWNPMSNGRLGSGTPPVPQLLAAGMRIGMGVDGEASSDRTDPFENMRSGLYQVRAREQRAAALAPRTVLRMHTLGAAEVIGVADRVGSIAVGKKADLLLLRRRPSRLDREDLAAAIVLGYGVTDIDVVLVAGRPVAGPRAPSP